MRYLGIAVVAGLMWTGLLNNDARADGPAWRGVRNDSFRRAAWHQSAERIDHGWTVTSEHFAVVATTSLADATWAAEELERTWNEIGRLADQWTTVHRQPGFGQAGISLVITRQPRHPQSNPTDRADLAPAGPDIYVNLSDSRASLEDRLPQMRSAAFAAFLRVCRHEMLLPEWVQVGLAAYFADTPAPEAPGGSLPPPDLFLAPTKGAWARHVMLGQGAVTVENQRQAAQAALWVRYLLEGNDAQYADQFFTALATSLAQGTQDELSSTAKARGVAPRPREPSPPDPLSWTRLIDERIASRGVSDWLADRDIGQPIVKLAEGEPPLDQRQREMLLILKLARRFSKAGSPTVGPQVKIQEYAAKPSATAASESEEPVSIDALYQRLTSRDQPRWATIDTDGRLLLSSDKERLAAIFANPDCTYRTYRQDGNVVLEATFASGEVLEGWLTENPAHPQRPIAHLRKKPIEPPATNPPTTDQPAAQQSATPAETTLRIVW